MFYSSSKLEITTQHDAFASGGLSENCEVVGPRGGNLGLYGVVGLGIGMREHLQKLRKNVVFMPVWPFLPRDAL